MVQRLRPEREDIARRRIATILEKYAVASARTLEQKISDAGPPGRRVDPHILTPVRNLLVKEKRLIKIENLWFARAIEDSQRLADKLARIRPVQTQISRGSFTKRLGQTLEIAVFKALMAANLNFTGGFLDLTDHDDSIMYQKEEPPRSFSGRRMPGKTQFDFIVFDDEAGPIGVEVKNIREWLYPTQTEIRELSFKAATADCVPVLVGRRIPFVTRLLFEQCGFVFFESFNQLYPSSETALAALASDKDLLGFHDIRVGNEPSPLLQSFVSNDLIPRARGGRQLFRQYSDLVFGFGTGEYSYQSFAARVRRRRSGRNEDSDEEPEESEG